jgi:hypothetical protein
VLCRRQRLLLLVVVRVDVVPLRVIKAFAKLRSTVRVGPSRHDLLVGIIPRNGELFQALRGLEEGHGAAPDAIDAALFEMAANSHLI